MQRNLHSLQNFFLFYVYMIKNGTQKRTAIWWKGKEKKQFILKGNNKILETFLLKLELLAITPRSYLLIHVPCENHPSQQDTLLFFTDSRFRDLLK